MSMRVTSLLAVVLASVFAAPMVIDGFTVLTGYRETTMAIRTVTGLLAGIGLVVATMQMDRSLLENTRV